MFIFDKKKLFIIIIIFLTSLLGLVYSFKDFVLAEYRNKFEYTYDYNLMMYYKKIDYCFFDYTTVKLIQEIPGKDISVINVGSFSNVLAIFSKKIPVNYYIFYGDTVITDNLSWQKNEIKNLNNFMPSVVIISKNSCKIIQRDELILDYLNENYYLLKSSDYHLIFRRKNGA